MFTAQDAREATKAYYAQVDAEEEKNAEAILAQILDEIKADANRGMWVYEISSSRELFKTLSCEERVVGKLLDLNFTVTRGKPMRITW